MVEEKNRPVPEDESTRILPVVLSPWRASESARKLIKNADALSLPLLILTQRTGESSRNLYFPTKFPHSCQFAVLLPNMRTVPAHGRFDELWSWACPSRSLPAGVRGQRQNQKES